MKQGKTSIHKQRFFPRTRVGGWESGELPNIELASDDKFLDVMPGTEVNIIKSQHGSFLCEKEGLIAWIDASWLSVSSPKVGTAGPDTRHCPRCGAKPGQDHSNGCSRPELVQG
jgi:hypothetical protein